MPDMANNRVVWQVPADHPCAAGHFPGNPIIPGAVLLQAVVAAIALQHPGLICRKVGSAKFLHPVRPGESLVITWHDAANGDVRFVCAVGPDGVPAVTGSMRFGAA